MRCCCCKALAGLGSQACVWGWVKAQEKTHHALGMSRETWQHVHSQASCLFVKAQAKICPPDPEASGYKAQGWPWEGGGNGV